MITEDTHFFSDGFRLGASFYWPDDADNNTPAPIVVACSGFTGLRHIHPARFARYLTARGIACFGFDYRGFADSEGPRCRVLLEEQVRDVRHAAAFVAGHQRVDAARIILLGWGMGAGLVLDAARQSAGVVGVIAINGFYNGSRVQIAHRGDSGYNAFCQRVEDERQQRAHTGIPAETDPFDIYPLDQQSRTYVDDVLRKTPGYEAETYSFELAESLLRWNPEVYAPLMAIPLLIAHGDQNELHPVGEAKSLYDSYGGAKQLFWIEGAGHTEFMDDADPKFQALGECLADWIPRAVNLRRGQ